jgi:hypothetical protein
MKRSSSMSRRAWVSAAGAGAALATGLPLTRAAVADATSSAGIAAGAAQSAVATRRARQTPLDLDTAQGNLDGFLKTRSDIGGKPSMTWASGTVWAQIPGRKGQPLMRTQALNMTRCIQDATGYQFLQRECVIFCDLKSGEPIERWFNPYVDRDVDVFHIRNSSVSSHYDVNGPKGPYRMDYQENGGEVVFFNDLLYFGPSPLNIEEYPTYASSNVYEGAGLYHWHTNRAALDDPRVTSAPTVTSHTGVRQWLPWMEMGAWTGQLILPSRGRKLPRGADEVPAAFRGWLEKNAPEYLQPPGLEQREERRTFYGEFKQHIDAKRKARAP